MVEAKTTHEVHLSVRQVKENIKRCMILFQSSDNIHREYVYITCSHFFELCTLYANLFRIWIRKIKWSWPFDQARRLTFRINVWCDAPECRVICFFWFLYFQAVNLNFFIAECLFHKMGTSRSLPEVIYYSNAILFEPKK